MNKTVFALLLVLASISGYSQEKLKKFRISGHIEGKQSGFVYFNYIPSGNGGIMDSSKLKNGNFIYNGLINEPTKAVFSLSSFSGKIDQEHTTDFYLEPGYLRLSVKVNFFKDLQLSGSKTNDEVTEYKGILKPIYFKIDNVSDSVKYYENVRETLPKKDSFQRKIANAKIDSLNILTTRLEKQKHSIDSIFIAQHPNSYLSPEILSFATIDWISFSGFQALFNLLADSIKQSAAGKKVWREIEKENALSVGKVSPSFVSVDSKGNTIDLQNYVGKKYVLLDFGASWCFPCKQIIPSLKNVYEKYSNWLEIIGVSHQEQEDDWRKSIKDDHLTWPQILENETHQAVSPKKELISDLFQVDQIPSLILLDKKLRIVAKYGAFYSSRPGFILYLNEKLATINESMQGNTISQVSLTTHDNDTIQKVVKPVH